MIVNLSALVDNGKLFKLATGAKMEMDFQRSKEHADKMNNEVEAAMAERSVASLREGAKATIAINGAAAVAILGFMGTVSVKVANAPVLRIPQLQVPLLIFAIGVILGASAFLLHAMYENRALVIFQVARRVRGHTEKNYYEAAAHWALIFGLVAFLAGCILTAVKL